MKAKVFVALDFPQKSQALDFAKRTVAINPYFKVGLELFVSEGPRVVSELRDLGAEIFLDLKFHDIPNTVAGAIRGAVRSGAGWMNIHCGGGAEMMRAAVQAANEEAQKASLKRPVLLGVTILTSLDDKAVEEIGFPRSVSAQVKHFVELAQSNGLDGVVCSAHELALVKSLAGKSFCTMVPGIRPKDSSHSDQKRVMSASEAVKAGADCLVIGRPITGAKDPAQALQNILEEL